MTEQQLWSLSMASEYLHCCEQSLRNYIRAGELTACLIGGRYLIANDDLEKFIEWVAGRSLLFTLRAFQDLGYGRSRHSQLTGALSQG